MSDNAMQQAIPDVELSVEAVVAASTAATGLSDFGEPAWEEMLTVLLKSLDQEAGLNTVGRAMHFGRVVNVMNNRARMTEWLKRCPQVLEESIDKPVVIVGLPRTGTTMLHRTLAADSRFHAPLWYEVRNPAPYMDWSSEVQEGVKDQRIVEAEAEVAMMLEANPELAAIHPMDPVGADEEIMILEQSFYSTVPEAYCELPSFAAWLEGHDNTPGYEFLKRALQFLQWQKKQRGEQAERWLLKTPHHLHYMSTLLKVFPDATVVQTHRDPLVTIPSIASFHYNLWILGCDAVDKKRVGSEWARKFCNGMAHTMATRAEQPEKFYDVWFKDTLAKPFEVIEKLYAHIGMELTEEARAAMEEHRDANRREDRPSHEYTLEEYGFSEEGLAEQFAAYREQFILQ